MLKKTNRKEKMKETDSIPGRPGRFWKDRKNLTSLRTSAEFVDQNSSGFFDELIRS